MHKNENQSFRFIETLRIITMLIVELHSPIQHLLSRNSLFPRYRHLVQ